MPGSTKRKAPAALATPVVRASAKVPSKAIIDEADTVITGTDAIPNIGVETIEISSGGSSEEYSSADEDEVEQANGVVAEAQSTDIKPAVNGTLKKSASTNEAAEDAGSDAEATSPSFGELLRGNDPIDVAALLQQPIAASTALTQPSKTINPVSHRSLTATLTQALKSDDTDLLESCLHTTDLVTIRNTIEEIDSIYAGTLLNKLASRLYRRPGRAGDLMTWVQWTLIAHGGALASQPKVVNGLNGLQKVLAERAKGLNSLLALKGKLDLLEGQMELRRKMQRSSGAVLDDESDEDVDENIIWVEGEDNLANGSRKRARNDEDDDDAAPLTNGYGGGSDDEDDDSVADQDEQSAAEEELDENEVEYDVADESMGEDEESDAEPAPPSKLQKVAGFFKRK